ncbi:hypothetical protein [Luteimicrobium album]|uniref:hypothetical protein n=1 Tax=Luteimicrobium album TaxID=1054550 RepID=UPI0024E0EE5B|nr:hypothetical protein [Luteimicrobium album]
MLPTLEQLRERFPGPGDVEPARLARVEQLKHEFLERVQPHPDPAVARHWATYQQIFSADGPVRASPADLKAFANIRLGAHPGNMSVFNRAWNELGDSDAADKLRGVIEYLLRGPRDVPLEDRLTTLITDRDAGMKGFRESLLTKVLCVVEDREYLPILTYTSPASAGKREVAQDVWGLALPDPHRVTWTIGRLIVWSNRLLLVLAGDGFATVHHAAKFLWWAKDRDIRAR